LLGRYLILEAGHVASRVAGLLVGELGMNFSLLNFSDVLARDS